MKKKNLIILLIFPFLISLFCIITVNTTYNRIDVDISYIEWSYHDMEGFQIADGGYLLEAVGVNQRYYKVSGDGSLVWKVQNKDPNETEPCAEIVYQGGKYYLKALREGEVIITCSNQKGNVYRQMTGVIYKDAAILLYPKIGGSQTNIDSTLYYGQFDHNVGTPAAIEMTMMVVPTSAEQELDISCSENIRFNYDTGIIDIVGAGKAELTLSLPSGLAKPRTFSFEIVEGGVNVYTYDDLMNCTNRSEHGEIVVLRKSFESLYNACVLDKDGEPLQSDGKLKLRANNVECFGNYDFKTKKFSFGDEVYRFTTTYNRNFIDGWNEFAKTNSSYSTVTDQIIVGLHVQKDFYGNGFTLNLHNLTYPYAYIPMTLESGEVVRIPQLTSDNLFRGPLAMYALGDPNKDPFLKLYGQDNVGMYVHGDGITVNDINLKNCEFGDRLANLETTGTVLEVAGDNVTVKNSLISNGKNVVRSFSSMELKLDNCMLSNSQNFLFLTGSNEFEPVDTKAMATFYDTLDGKTKKALIDEFLAPNADGDKIINEFLTTVYKSSDKKEDVKKSLLSIQSALNTAKKMEGNFKGSTLITDCYFYQSGISSICLESLFNSPYIETGSPSMISVALDAVVGKIPYTPTHTTGTSYPVKVNISGNTRFYDYKKVSTIDLGGLIQQTVTDKANTLLNDREITLDTIFPLKSMAVQRARSQGAVMKNADTGEDYVNIPVTYYGGGLNLSEVTMDGYENSSSVGGKTEINLLNTYLDIQSTGDAKMDMLNCAMRRVVPAVTGFEPFAFRFTTGGYLYGETPNATDLIANTKGE